MIHALLWQLTNQAGVTNQADITVGDPSRIIGQPIWDRCHPAFPQVKFADRAGGDGRFQAQPGLSPGATLRFADTNVWADGARRPDAAVIEATYVINLALLRGHSLAGISACAKNWFGSLWVNYNTNSAHKGWPPSDPDAMNGLHGYIAAHDFDNGGNWIFTERPMKTYSPLVEVMGHKDLGGKTLLYMVDGLYAAKDQSDAVPCKSQSAPFNQDWTSSLFGSQDPVAIDSVYLDFLRAEPGYAATIRGTLDNYLHEAAQADDPPSGDF